MRKTIAILASFACLAATGTAVVFQPVSVSVNGQTSQIPYLGRTVAQVLQASGQHLTAEDTVTPSLDADALAAGNITVTRGLAPEIPIEAAPALAQPPATTELAKLKGVSLRHSNEGLGLLPGLPAATRDSCIASMYDEPQGTASGEVFDPEAMTAAHKTLPLGSRVRVTNPANGKTVLVRINDRGPYIAGRCLDLSRASFRAIGNLGQGLMTVYYEVD